MANSGMAGFKFEMLAVASGESMKAEEEKVTSVLVKEILPSCRAWFSVGRWSKTPTLLEARLRK